MTLALWNGVPDSAPSLQSRGLHYGDGVFRTMLVADGQVQALPDHLDVLQRDAIQLAMQPPSAALLASECQALAAGQRRSVLKLMLMRRAGGRGYRPGQDDCDRLMLLSDAPVYPRALREQGIRAFRSAVVLSQQPLLAGAKHLNRLEQVLASRDWPESMDEAILCDGAEHAICGSRSNLFWVRDGALGTSPLQHCGVRGVTRDRILSLARRLRLDVALADLPWTALLAADEAFVCNSLIGLWPLRELADRRWSAPGPVTRALLAGLNHPDTD